MIVLRIDVNGHSADVRWSAAEAVLGSGETAAIQRDDAGWRPREAVLVHVGTSVMVVRADGSGTATLRVGDSLRLGDATLTLVGLLPLAVDDAEPTTGTSSPMVAASPALVLERGPPARASAPPSPRAQPGTTSPPSVGKPVKASEWPRRFGARSFDDELVAVMKRSPWWVASAAVHGVVIALLMFLAPTDPVEKVELVPYGVVGGLVEPEQPLESGGPTDRAETTLTPEEVRAPEVDEETLPQEPPFPEDEPLLAPPVPATERDATLEEPPESPEPVIGPSRDTVRMRISEKTVVGKKATSPSDLDRVNEDAERSLDVVRTAAARVRDDIASGGGALGRALRGLKTEDILVVHGTFDHMDTVLEELVVPFALRRPHELLGEDLTRHKVIFWNCGDLSSGLRPHEHQKLVTAVREFVRGGGYLFTTDWAVATIVVPAFPGYLRTEGRTKPLAEMIVDIVPTAAGRGHPLLEGVFDTGVSPRWWLEASTFDVAVARPDDVVVLAEAPELARPPLERSPAIAVTFKFGRGRVLHVVGHYYQQKGNVSGSIGVQRLPLNFVRMRVEGVATK